MSTSAIRIKQGDSIEWTATDVAASAVVGGLTGWTVRSDVRGADGTLAFSFVVTLLDQSVLATRGKFTLTYDDTSAIAVGSYACDIRKELGDQSIPTATFTLHVVAAVTPRSP